MPRFVNRARSLTLALVLIVIATLSATTQADPIKLQFDLGRSTGPITQSVSSPGLAAGAFTVADTKWNGITASAATTFNFLQYTDGSAATGVVAQVGSVGAGSPTSTITWNDNTNLGDVGPTGDAGIGIYTGNNMVQFLSFYNVNFNNSGGAIGLQVSGLAPANYGVYVTAAHPQALSRTYDIGIGVNLTQQVGSPTALTAGATSTWQVGANYAVGTVTVTSTSDWISVISSNLNAFPEINGIQIVALPEPSSMALVGGAGLMLARRRRN